MRESDAKVLTLNEFINAITSPDDFTDLEVYRFLVHYLESLGDSDDISDEVVHTLFLYRPGVQKMINIEVESITIAEMFRGADESL